MLYSLPASIIKDKRGICEHLARLILEGKFKRNEILPNELDLAKGFGVSRTLMRDILRSLEGKGLIERKAHTGTRVRGIHSWNLLDSEVLNWGSVIFSQQRLFVSLLELRLIIEPQAAALSAMRANHDELQNIHSSFEEMLESDSDGDIEQINPQGDMAFHEAIINASGNLFISQFGGVIRAALFHTISSSVRALHDHSESIENHRRLLNAIESRNPQQAYAAMVQVLQRTLTDMKILNPGIILSDLGNNNQDVAIP
ncbi:MAG: FadR family transcriptional regulator [Xanthomonadales bacterium]|nr:FadR family transcriptional regulator [Xanthomonadales bacterium]